MIRNTLYNANCSTQIRPFLHAIRGQSKTDLKYHNDTENSCQRKETKIMMLENFSVRSYFDSIVFFMHLNSMRNKIICGDIPWEYNSAVPFPNQTQNKLF